MVAHGDVCAHVSLRASLSLRSCSTICYIQTMFFFQVDKAELIKDNVDFEAIKGMFDLYDVDKNGSIDVEEFSEMIIKLGVAPKLGGKKKSF